jgi:hypothetical protein
MGGDARSGLPLKAALSLADTPDLAAPRPWPPEYAAEAGGEEALARFRERLLAFRAEARFDAFLEAHRAAYEKLESEARAQAAGDVTAGDLAAYLGRALPGSYRFVAAPLLPPDYETNFRLSGARAPSWIWLRPLHDGGRGPRFRFDEFGNSAVHEVAHVVLNSLVGEPAGLAGAPPKGCNDRVESSWRLCVQEHVVYAVTLRLLARRRGEAAADALRARYESSGFPYLGRLCARLREYEAGRKRWPALSDFYPRLEAVFREPA